MFLVSFAKTPGGVDVTYAYPERIVCYQPNHFQYAGTA